MESKTLAATRGGVLISEEEAQRQLALIRLNNPDVAALVDVQATMSQLEKLGREVDCALDALAQHGGEADSVSVQAINELDDALCAAHGEVSAMCARLLARVVPKHLKTIAAGLEKLRAEVGPVLAKSVAS